MVLPLLVGLVLIFVACGKAVYYYIELTHAANEGARRAVRLRVSGAFHSPLVAHAADRLRPAIDRIDFKAPTAHFMSTVTGRDEPPRRCHAVAPLAR